jgi:hypothetical protein
VAALLLASSVLTPALAVSPVLAEPGTRQVTSAGSAQLVSRPDGPEGGVSDPEFAQGPDDAREGGEGSEVQFRQGAGPSTGLAAAGPQVASAQLVAKAAARVNKSFDGLNFREQRLANGGNQFSVEPPDQGLCVGNGVVIETINDVIRVFDTSGNPLSGVTDLNSFYGYPAQIVRATPGHPQVQGPFVTDPSCWFDAPTQRWFHVVLTLEVFPDTGDFTGVNHLDLAVSRTGNPFDGFNIYRLDVTDDGTNTTPNHACPPRGRPVAAGHHEPTHPNACIGDFPHLGADKHGFFLTSNEYCLFCPGIGFHAAQVYAFDKRALARGDSTVFVFQIDTLGQQAGKPGFTLWPATSPGDADFEPSHAGTEYFTSSNAAEEVSGVPNSQGTNKSNQIVVWALTNTVSLKTSTPAIRLLNTTVQVDQYAVPGLSTQKAGNFPLGQCINDTTTPTIFGIGCWTAIFTPAGEPAHNEVEGTLDSSDSRVLSTTFVRGHLWGTLDTSVNVGGKTQAGVLWYIIIPHLSSGVTATLVRQGHIALANNNAIYGTVAATPTGRALVGFTLVGADHYPSSAYVSLNGPAGPADINVIAEGQGPQDGFTEYKATTQDPPRPRWGDYGASVATGDNTIWVAAEYIAQTCTLAQYMTTPFGSCGGTRATLGNWATRITSIDVSP